MHTILQIRRYRHHTISSSGDLVPTSSRHQAMSSPEQLVTIIHAGPQRYLVIIRFRHQNISPPHHLVIRRSLPHIISPSGDVVPRTTCQHHTCWSPTLSFDHTISSPEHIVTTPSCYQTISPQGYIVITPSRFG